MSDKGFSHHNPLVDIALLRDNLRDRYKSGIPVIIKELLQNADDAGDQTTHASCMHIGWAPMLLENDHPLLSSPGLFVINDGPFKKTDAEAIRNLGLSYKAEESSSIGKFGLGLKSVFHLCEAFFYLTSDVFEEAIWDQDQFPRADVLNPWSPKFHSEWDNFSEEAQNALKRMVKPVVKGHRWFCLWIPLRRQSHNLYPIMDGFLGDSMSHREVFTESLEIDIANELPLLKNIREVCGWSIDDPDTEPKTVFRVVLDVSSARTEFVGIKDKVSGQHQLRGKISVAKFQNEGHSDSEVIFEGLESFSSSPKLAKLKESAHWPKFTTYDPTTTETKNENEKAYPHSAICFTRHPKRPDKSARLSIRWAVFLPVGESVEKEVNGNFDYTLTLHGYFFVDAGRTNIDFASTADADGAPNSELELRQRWNGLLARDGTMSLVIPALQSFFKEISICGDEARVLVEAISTSPSFYNEHKEHICRQYQLIPEISEGELHWLMLGSREPFYEIFSPDKPGSQTHFDIFPELRSLMNEYSFTLREWPRMTTSSARPWTEAMFKRLLKINVNSVFGDGYSLAYFNRVLEDFTSRYTQQFLNSPLLVDIARAAFGNLSISVLYQESSSIKKFISLIPATKRLKIEADLSTVSETIVREFSRLDVNILLVPSIFEPEERDTKSEGVLKQEETVSMLSCLHVLVEHIGNSGETYPQRMLDKLIIQLLSNNSLSTATILKQCGNLKIMRGHDCSTGTALFLCYDELVSLADKKALFSKSSETLEKDLQTALEKQRLVLVELGLSKILFPDREIGPCDRHACIQLLLTTPSLSIKAENRKGLIQSLLSGSEVDYNENKVKALRYLLHHDNAHFGDVDDLIIGDLSQNSQALWTRIVHLLLERLRAKWRVIDDSLGRLVPPSLWPFLGVKQMGQSSVEDLMWEVGPGTLRFESFSADDRIKMLKDIDDLDLLKQLHIYDSTTGRLSPVTRETYIDSGISVSRDLTESITILHKIDDSELFEKQRRLVPLLDHKTIIGICLKQNNPSKYWQTIMDNLQRLSKMTDLGDYTLSALRKTPWLVTEDGKHVPANDVIHIKELQDDVTRVISTSAGLFTAGGSLLHSIREHEAFHRLEKFVFPNIDDALDMLVEVMSTNSEYHIGANTSETVHVSDFLEAFNNYPRGNMPSYSIIKSIWDKFPHSLCDDHVVPKVSKELPAESIISILNYLRQEYKKLTGDKKEQILRVFNWYLGGVPHEALYNVLGRIELLNTRKGWKRPSELCLEAEGIDEGHIVDIEQAVILRRIEPALGGETIISYGGEKAQAFVETDFEESAERLDDYFKKWGVTVVPQGAVGGFLCILGDYPKIVKMAEDYLGKNSIDITRAGIDWVPLPTNLNVVGGGEDMSTVLSYQRFLVEIVKSGYVDLRSLINTPFSAALSKNFNTIFIEGGEFPHVPGKRVNGLRLREFEPNDFGQEKLSKLLLESTRLILKRIYYQDASNLDEVWAHLAKSEQLDIRIAQDLILDSAFFYFGQLGVHGYDKIKETISSWDRARHRKAEEDHLGLDAQMRPVGQRTANQDIKKAREDLRKLIENDEQTRSVILRAMREKMEKQYQYRLSSIPFELFQNADDAYIELKEMEGEKGLINPGVGSFVVIHDAKRIVFVHWGRHINQYSRGGFEGGKGRDLGFDKDLEKMLILSSSDKSLGADGNRLRVTGKFGLGFKSVFLISDNPRVISGQLGFEILGGFYPEPWSGDQLAMLKELVAPFCSAKNFGTVFELPANDNARLSDVLTDFTALAPIILVFSKQIKRCQVVQGNGGEPLTFEVNEQPFEGIDGLSSCTLKLPEWTEEKTALIWRTDNGMLLSILDARGFTTLPAQVPTVWVTAPTREYSDLGVALNGPFDVDVGRAQLARDSQRNLSLAESIGEAIGDIMCATFKTSQFNWCDLRQKLRLAEDLSQYSFWESFWRLFTRSFEPNNHDQSMHQNLVYRLLWGGPAIGMRKAIASCPMVPTGLRGEYRVLTKAGDIKFFLDDVLGTEGIFKKIAVWDTFSKKGQPGQVVSRDIFNTLNRVACGTFLIQRIDPYQLLLWEVTDDQRIDEDKAKRLGTVMNKVFIAEEAKKGSISDIDMGKMVQMLRGLRFRSKNGAYSEVRNLVIRLHGAEDQKDEMFRASFAPEARVLDDNYKGTALDFFLVCRGDLFAPAKELAKWLMEASTTQQKKDGLGYILGGEIGVQMAAEVRNKLAGTWMNDLNDTSSYLAVHNFNDRQTVLGLLGLLVSPNVGELSKKVKLPPPDEILKRIHEWWLAEGASRITDYEKKVYPEWYKYQIDRLSKFVRDPDSHGQWRKTWLILLLIGSCHTLGRTKPEQHKGFISICEQYGWLKVFVDPKTAQVEWLNLLKDYFDKQMDVIPYYLWMKQFVSVYCLANWLDKYVEAFLDVNKPGQFLFDDILRVRTSQRHQGGGPDAPPISNILGMGAHFVMRELVRKDCIKNPHAFRYCYPPVKRLRELLRTIGCFEGNGSSGTQSETSEQIYASLSSHMGAEKATFGNAFDIPLLLVAEDRDLQERLLQRTIITSSNDLYEEEL